MSILSDVRNNSLDINYTLRVKFDDVMSQEIENEIRVEEKKIEHKDPYNELKRYIGDFLTSKESHDRINDRINILHGSSFKEKARKFLLGLIRIKIECIYAAKKSDMELKSYQRKAVDFMATHRGMIAAFEMGSGKTLTAVAIANCMIYMTKYIGISNFRVIIVTSPTLRQNFIKEMRAYGVNPELALEGYFVFLTYRELIREIKNKYEYCNNSLVIIDEAHNMRTDYRGIFTVKPKLKEFEDEKLTQANASIICSEEAMKVLLLTGTPFYNSTTDIINLAAMVKGEDPSEKDPYKWMKEDYESFKDYYQDLFLFHKNDGTHFPKRSDVIYNIVMDKDILTKYESIENITERNIKMGITESRGRGRPSEKVEDLDEVTETTKRDGRGSNAYMAPVRTAVNDIEPCIKCEYLLRIVKYALSNSEKVLIFSDFKETGGYQIQRILSRNSIKSMMIDGSVDPAMRPLYVQNFNDDKIKVLIVTRTGGEGIDLKRVRHVISFEKGWNIASMEQYIGRAIRYNSHLGLPPDQQTVKVWHLMLIKPSDYRNMPQSVLNYAPNEFHNLRGNENLKVDNPDKSSVDLYLFCRALEKQVVMDELKIELEKIQIGNNSKR